MHHVFVCLMQFRLFIKAFTFSNRLLKAAGEMLSCLVFVEGCRERERERTYCIILSLPFGHIRSMSTLEFIIIPIMEVWALCDGLCPACIGP